MKLERHGVWGIFDDRASSLDEFTKNFLPEMKLRREVSEDVVKAY